MMNVLKEYPLTRCQIFHSWMAALSATLLDIGQTPFDLFEAPLKIVFQRFDVLRTTTERYELRNRWKPIARDETADHHSATPETHMLFGVQAGHRLFESIEHVGTGRYTSDQSIP